MGLKLFHLLNFKNKVANREGVWDENDNLLDCLPGLVGYDAIRNQGRDVRGGVCRVC